MFATKIFINQGSYFVSAQMNATHCISGHNKSSYFAAEPRGGVERQLMTIGVSISVNSQVHFVTKIRFTMFATKIFINQGSYFVSAQMNAIHCISGHNKSSCFAAEPRGC